MSTTIATSPSGQGPYFGEYGGRWVPEPLVAALDELTTTWESMRSDPVFLDELAALHRDYTGRPSPLTEVPRFAAHAGGARDHAAPAGRADVDHGGQGPVGRAHARAGDARV